MLLHLKRHMAPCLQPKMSVAIKYISLYSQIARRRLAHLIWKRTRSIAIYGVWESWNCCGSTVFWPLVILRLVALLSILEVFGRFLIEIRRGVVLTFLIVHIGQVAIAVSSFQEDFVRGTARNSR